MASKRQRLENKQRNRKIKQYYQKKKDIENHKNNPKLQMETIKEFTDLDIEKASISDIERLDADLDDFIKLLRQKTKQYEEINEDDNAAYKYAYNYIIQGIIEKVNNMKYYNMYNHIDDKELKIPDWVFEGKEYKLIDKTIKPEYVYSQWLDKHETHIRETNNWCYMELNMLDMMLVDHKEYLGLLINSQFAQNFEKASKLAGDDLVALDELNKIINEEVLVDDNNAHHTYQRIVDRFNELKDEVFYESEQVREELVKNADNRIKTARNMSKAEKDKIFGRN